MEMTKNDAIFTELTEDEAAALNGGYYCYWVRLSQWFCNAFGCFTRIVWAVRCY